jgi:hypothetical protein
MKKCIFILALSLILSISLGWNAMAQVPKEGTFSSTVTYAGTNRIFPLDKDRAVVLYENSGVAVDDSGGGPFHRVATHNVGILYIEKGVSKLIGYYSITDKDGDKVLWELTETEGKPSPPNPVPDGTSSGAYGGRPIGCHDKGRSICYSGELSVL